MIIKFEIKIILIGMKVGQPEAIILLYHQNNKFEDKKHLKSNENKLLKKS